MFGEKREDILLNLLYKLWIVIGTIVVIMIVIITIIRRSHNNKFPAKTVIDHIIQKISGTDENFRADAIFMVFTEPICLSVAAAVKQEQNIILFVRVISIRKIYLH